MTVRSPRFAGVLLAAGLGRRFGGPKALADTGDGPWVLRALDTLSSLGERIVVVGAQADDVRALLPPGVTAVDNPDYAGGMGSSLIAGIRALDDRRIDVALVMLVDLPDVTAEVVQRVVAEVVRHARTAAAESIEYDGIPAPGQSPAAAARPEGHVIHRVRNTLARATFHGKPGHPVVLGADHFAGVLASATGDRGARDYLAHRRVLTVECGDLAGGRDVDRNPGAG